MLCARWHAGGRSRALNIEEDAGNLSVVRQADELAHERDARPCGRREGARPGPAGADRYAGRRELILRLQDAVVVPLRLGIDAISLAQAGEGFHERGRGGDRIPRPYRRPRVQAA